MAATRKIQVNGSAPIVGSALGLAFAAGGIALLVQWADGGGAYPGSFVGLVWPLAVLISASCVLWGLAWGRRVLVRDSEIEVRFVVRRRRYRWSEIRHFESTEVTPLISANQRVQIVLNDGGRANTPLASGRGEWGRRAVDNAAEELNRLKWVHSHIERP